MRETIQKIIEIVKINICHIFLEILDVYWCTVCVWDMSESADGFKKCVSMIGGVGVLFHQFNSENEVLSFFQMC